MSSVSSLKLRRLVSESIAFEELIGFQNIS